MYLKSLKIYGFKTFGRKVTIDFQHGITAIVGPNGSGKSNLIEALNWVVGETRMADLRVKTADQLIFHGSPSMKPLSIAEVSLTIENSDNHLPIDYTEVNITRRLSKDGTSEYYLNKNRCIMKDITNLFMGTGVGRGAYSVMRQGEIDRMLRQKPEDRRELFEEAAGILKFRTRRRETERDLAKAETNLKQIRPTLIEVERQYAIKKKQAERAQKFAKLDERRIEVEVDIHLMRVLELKRKLEVKQEQYSKLLEKKNSVTGKLHDLEQEIDHSMQQSRDLQQDQHRVQTQIMQQENEVAELKQKKIMLNEKISAQKDNVNSWGQGLAQNRSKLEGIQEQISELITEKNSHLEMINGNQDSLERYANDIKQIEQILDDDAKNIDIHKQKIDEIQNDLVAARQELEDVINRLVEAIDKRKAELKGSTELKINLKERISRSLDEMLVFLKSRKDIVEDLINSDFAGRTDKARLGQVLDGFKSGLTERLTAAEQLKQDFSQLDYLISGFDEIIFAREGIHSRKEAIEQQIVQMVRDEKGHRERILFLETDIKNQTTKIESIKQMMHDTQLNLAKMREKLNASEQSIQTREQYKRDIEGQIENLQENIKTAGELISGFISEQDAISKELEAKHGNRDELKKKLEKISEDLSSISDYSSSREKRARSYKEELESLHEKVDAAGREVTVYEVEIRSTYDNFYENYSINLQEHEGKIANKTFDMAALRTELKKIKEQITSLGSINLLALDECRELEERFKLLKEQVEDIETSRKNLLEIIKEINKNSEEIFLQTFDRIKVNFHKIFRRLFNGGKGELKLTDPDNVLESGVEILVQPPSKALQNEALLSGGERSMTAIALLFAIFMVKPSPFCLLDEIDAALDGPNIERFKKMLLEFKETTQFLMISHNINTLKVADALYGISMEEDGVTTALSLDINELEKLKNKYKVE